MESTRIRPEQASDPGSLAMCRFVSAATGWFAVVVGLSALAGWALNLDVLKSLAPGLVAMKPNTAVACVFSGLALLLLRRDGMVQGHGRRLTGRFCAALVAGVGLLTLAEYAFGLGDTILDQMLFPEAGGAVATLFAERMSPVAACGFLSLGSALLLSGNRRVSVWLVQILSHLTGFASFTVIVDQFYTVVALHHVAFLQTTLSTAVTQLVLAAGVLCSRTNEGVGRLFTASTLGAVMVRRLLLPLVLLPVFINWLEVAVEHSGLFPPGFAWTLDATLMVVLGGALIWWVALQTHRIDRDRIAARAMAEQSEERYRLMVEACPVAILILYGEAIEFVNPAALSLLGASGQEEVVGRSLLSFAHAEHRTALDIEILSRIEGGETVTQKAQNFVRLDGTARQVEVTASPVKMNGQRVVQLLIRDVTERRRAEEQVRLQAQAMDASNEMIFLSDAEGRLTYINQAVVEILGYAKDEVVGRHPEMFNSPRNQPGIVEDIIQSACRAFWRGELFARRKDGSELPVHLSASPVRNTSGRIISLIGIAKDITGRKLAEEKLQDAWRRAEVLAELGRKLGNTTSLRNAAQEALRAADDLLGWDCAWLHLWDESAQRFDPVLCYDVLDGVRREVPSAQAQWVEAPPMDRRVKAEGAQLILRRSETDATEDFQVFGSGRRSLSLMFVPIREGEQFSGILSIQSYQAQAYDQSALALLQGLADHCAGTIDRIITAGQLRESEERYRSAFEFAAIGMAQVTPDGRWLQVNQALCQMVGYSEEELLARTFQDLTHPEDLEGDLNYVRQMLAGERETYRMEKRYFHKQGHVVWVLLSVSMVRDTQGQPLFFISQVLDMTERKLAEKEIYALSERLLSAREGERRRIAREMHDSTAQHLAALALNLHLLKEYGVVENTDAPAWLEECDRLTQSALGEIRTMAYLLHPPLLEELGLLPALREYVTGLANRSGLLIHLELPDEWEPMDEVVELAAFRVVQEALGNVLRHSGSKDAVVRLVRELDWVRLEIEDHGRGLPGGGSGNETGRQGGIGVGIAGMRDRARLLGGTLEMTSNHQGTTVRLSLPARRRTP